MPTCEQIAQARAQVQQYINGLQERIKEPALVVVTPLVGVWTDHVGLRAPLLIGLFSLAAATLLFAFAPAFPLLLLARALQGIAAGVSWTADPRPAGRRVSPGGAWPGDGPGSIQHRGGHAGRPATGRRAVRTLGHARPFPGGSRGGWGGWPGPRAARSRRPASLRPRGAL